MGFFHEIGMLRVEVTVQSKFLCDQSILTIDLKAFRFQPKIKSRSCKDLFHLHLTWDNKKLILINTPHTHTCLLPDCIQPVHACFSCLLQENSMYYIFRVKKQFIKTLTE